MWEEKENSYLQPGERAVSTRYPHPPLLKASFSFKPKSRPRETLQEDRARDPTLRIPSEGKVVQARASTLKKERWLKILEVTGCCYLSDKSCVILKSKAPREGREVVLIHKISGAVRQRELEWKEFCFL